MAYSFLFLKRSTEGTNRSQTPSNAYHMEHRRLLSHTSKGVMRIKPYDLTIVGCFCLFCLGARLVRRVVPVLKTLLGGHCKCTSSHPVCQFRDFLTALESRRPRFQAEYHSTPFLWFEDRCNLLYF